MHEEQTAADMAEERERYPFGKPRPYTPDHPNLLAEGLPVPQPESVRLVSGVATYLLVSVALLVVGYGVKGVLTNDLYLPAKRGGGTHFHGLSAWCICGMLASFAACLIALTFSELDAVKRKLKNQNLLTGLVMSAVLFMFAGFAVLGVYG